MESKTGRRLGVLLGLDLASDKAVSHQLLMRDAEAASSCWTCTGGIYAVPRTGQAVLLLSTPRFVHYAMWGG